MRETADTAHAGRAIFNPPRNKTFPEALLLLRGRADRWASGIVGIIA